MSTRTKPLCELQQPDLQLLTDSQDVVSVLRHLFGQAWRDAWGDCSGALVRVKDGDYVEVWLTVWSRPYALDAVYARVIPAGGDA